MNASELCDQLKAKIAQLEDELKATKDSRNDFKGQLEDHQGVLRKLAEHMAVGAEGTVYEVEHRIWVAVNDLRRVRKIDAADMEELANLRHLRGKEDDNANQMRATLHFIADELGLGSRNALPERQWFLKHLQELRVKVDDVKKLGFELKDYHAKYQALDKATDEACNFAGLERPHGSTVQEDVLDGLDRLSKACVADTTDARIKWLERVCYGAESRSGVSCREINPWRRIEYVLNTMAAELAHLRVQGNVPEAVRTKVWAIQRNLGAEVNDYTHRNEAEEVIKALEAIEAKAYEAQNVRAACIKLKELL